MYDWISISNNTVVCSDGLGGSVDTLFCGLARLKTGRDQGGPRWGLAGAGKGRGDHHAQFKHLSHERPTMCWFHHQTKLDCAWISLAGRFYVSFLLCRPRSSSRPKQKAQSPSDGLSVRLAPRLRSLSLSSKTRSARYPFVEVTPSCFAVVPRLLPPLLLLLLLLLLSARRRALGWPCRRDDERARLPCVPIGGCRGANGPKVVLG